MNNPSRFAPDLVAANRALRHATPVEIVAWTLRQARRPIATTSFGRESACILHVVAQVQRDLGASIPVVWLDSGYATTDTLQHVEKMRRRYDIDLRHYKPALTPADIVDKWGGIPSAKKTPDAFQEFVSIVKLRPFDRMLEELTPDAWLTGIRRNETEFRKSLDIVSNDPRQLVRIAPFFYFSDDEVLAYTQTESLPIYFNYFDPTKTAEDEECGLHVAP